MGYSHSLVIARQDTEQEKERLKKLPEYNPRTIWCGSRGSPSKHRPAETSARCGFILVSSARATSCLQVIHTSQIPAKYFLQKFGQGLKVMVNGGFEATRFLFEHLSREWIGLSIHTIFPHLFLFIVAVLELLNYGCYSKTLRRMWDWKWPILHTCAFFYTIHRIWKRCVLFLVHSFTMFMAEQFMGQICAAGTDYNHNLMSGCVILTWCIPFKRYIPFLWTLVFKGASTCKLPPHICSFLW